MIYSFVNAFNIILDRKIGKKTYDDLIEKYDIITPELPHYDKGMVEEKISIPNLDWNNLLKDYPTMKGWIQQENTTINYPIVQGIDNDYYLYYTINGEYCSYGTPFIDYRIERPFEQNLTIIYGHNMHDGSIFGSLTEYLSDETYYDSHKYMILYVPEKVYVVEIIGYAEVYGLDEIVYNPYMNNSTNYFNLLKQHMKSDSILSDDKLILLSTCTELGARYTDNRVVVWGKLLE